MKILFFDDYRLGILKGDQVVDVTDIVADIPHVRPQDLMVGLIEQFENYRPRIEAAVRDRNGPSVGTVQIRPPLPKPSKILCMAVNYMEDGTRAEPAPIDAFYKPSTAVIGDGDTMVLPDIPATIFEGEAELAVIIGKRATNVAASEAMSYVFGYMNFIDGSARGVGSEKNMFFSIKSRDTFAPIGPYIVTADEIEDPHRLPVRLWNNGTLMQSFNTDDMAHKIPRCIEWCSAVQTLEPGDVIATGTNHRGLNPFQDGDQIELEVEGLGRLHVNVRDDLKRTWARRTRLEHAELKLEGPTTPQLTGKYAD
jgi:2-keto-4-pentenoate hydratase/2-oxohepta-3-ene-1,7-dioic acid hydratase (catechol pathway)